MLAAQLSSPISYFNEQQTADLLEMKKKLGLPDARFDEARLQECLSAKSHAPIVPSEKLAGVDVESLVRTITKSVLEALSAK